MMADSECCDSSEQIDLLKCIICQKITDSMNLESAILGDKRASKLGDQLIKFSQIPGYEFPQGLTKGLICQKTGVKEYLISRFDRLLIHKSCYDKFNDTKYQRAQKSSLKRPSSDENLIFGSPCTRRKTGSGIPFGEEICLFCKIPDLYDPKMKEKTYKMKLHAAGAKEDSSAYVDQFSSEMRKMAAALSDTGILSVLETRDVRASELFYHNHCYTAFVRKYKALLQSSKEQQSLKVNIDDSFAESVALDAVRCYVKNSSESSFQLLMLEQIYLEKLAEFEILRSSHITRFAEKLKYNNCGVLPIQKESTFEHKAIKRENFEQVLTSPTEWFLLLRRVINPIREEILENQSNSDLTKLKVSNDSQEIPSTKLKLLLTILCNDSPSLACISKPLKTIGHLIFTNTKKFHRISRESASTDTVVSRHNRHNEAFIPQYLTLKLYSTIRSKDLVQTLFHHGIGLSYWRVQTLYDEMSACVAELYRSSGNRVLPSNVRKNLFTVFVDDNIDQNSSSTNASMHFHGSSISIFQFPTKDESGEIRKRCSFEDLPKEKQKLDLTILDQYINVEEKHIKANKIYCPIQSMNIPQSFHDNCQKLFNDNLNKEFAWMENVSNNVLANEQLRDEVGKSCMNSWTGYHIANNQDISEIIPTINTPLPVIDHPSNDINFQYHVMKIAIDYSQFVNCGQTPVGCSDQPLYALKKKIQWTFPEIFNSKLYFPVLGGLHLEQALLGVHGQLLRGTGIEDIIGLARLPTVGLKTAVLDVNNIKKARYTLQVIAPCLYKNLMLSHQESDCNLSLHIWAKQEAEKEVMFLYWYGILELQAIICLLVRSYREGNLHLLISTLQKAVGLFFALDHHNYARWLSVYIQDLELLQFENPELFKSLCKNMSVSVSGLSFSKIAYDQLHEMNNKRIKATNGYINLVNQEDKKFLRKIEMCSPEIFKFLDEAESSVIGLQNHKEKTSTFGHSFENDVKNLYVKMTINPFRVTQFQKLSSAFYFPAAIVSDCQKIFSLGQKQYESFKKQRFVWGLKDVVQDPIKKNNLNLPADIKSVEQDFPLIHLTPAMITKIQEACTVRKELAKQLFCQEFTNLPECFLDKDGKPFHGKKSDLINVILPRAMSSNHLTEFEDNIECLIVDLSVIIRSEMSILSSSALTYSGFIDKILRHMEHLAMGYNVSRLDLVLDNYSNLSIKGATREARGNEARVVFEETNTVPEDFNAFFLNNENKIKFNKIISKHAANPSFWNIPADIVVTWEKKVWFKSAGLQDIMSYIDIVHEEADNRLIVHIIDALKKDMKSILLKTVDTDIIVLLLFFMKRFKEYCPDVKIWVDFGLGDYRRIVSINSYFDYLGDTICTALLFFHAFTGCDSTTSFYRKSKAAWFKLWTNSSNFNEISACMQQLSCLPSDTTVTSSFDIIEKFVNDAYISSNSTNSINETRYQIFTSSVTGNLRQLPPSRNALEQHILRSSFQAGWVWGNTLSQINPPPLSNWGWNILPEKQKLEIKWTNLLPGFTEASIILKALVKTCKCNPLKSSCLSCKCGKENVKCLRFCNCKRNCELR